MPPEVFEALPPEVFGFGFGPAGDPGELLGQAAANALALQADADQMILDARAADADPNRLELLNATAKRMSAAATELAVVVARAEGEGAQIHADVPLDRDLFFMMALRFTRTFHLTAICSL